MASKADLELLVGLAKDPSFDRMVNDLPRETKAKFKGAFGGIEQSGKSAFGNIAQYATQALAMAGIGGLGAVAFQRVGAVADLNHGLAILGRTAQLTESQEDALAASMKRVAMDTGISRDEQLAGLQLMQDRYAVVNELANEGTLGNQMELAAKFQNAFNLAAEDTYNLLGALNKQGITGDALIKNLAFLEKASAQGSLGFKELGQVLPELLGAAKAFGQEGDGAVRDVAAMVEGVTGVIQDAERARTYVRSTLARLGQEDVGEKLADLGVQTKDAHGDFRDLSDVITEILGKLKKMSEGERAARLKDIFGSEEAIQTMSALMQGETAFKGILEVETDSRDFTKFLEDQSNDAATGMDRMKESLKDLIDSSVATDENLKALAMAIPIYTEAIRTSVEGIQATAEWLAAKSGIEHETGRAEDARGMSDAEQTASRAVWSTVLKTKHGGLGKVYTKEEDDFIQWYADEHGITGGRQSAILQLQARQKLFMGIGGNEAVENANKALIEEYAASNPDLGKTEAGRVYSPEEMEARERFKGAFGFSMTPSSPGQQTQTPKEQAAEMKQAVKDGIKEGMAEQKPPTVNVNLETSGSGAETPAAEK